MKACLRKLGLKVNEGQNTIPSLSRLHLTSTKSPETTSILTALKEITHTGDDGEEYIKDENDTFHLEKPSAWSLSKLEDSLPGSSTSQGDDTEASSDAEDKILDYSTVIKRLVVHEKDHPSGKETPYFNHQAYFSNLEHYQSQDRDANTDFGKYLLYGEVVTSTNTLLEKQAHHLPITTSSDNFRNTQLLRRLPAGFTATATVQVAGRGRGSNVWVSPAGSLMFSTVVRHPMSVTSKAPVVFLQYLAALAIVEGVHSYDKGYQTLPLKLKWPNDICTSDLFLSLRATNPNFPLGRCP